MKMNLLGIVFILVHNNIITIGIFYLLIYEKSKRTILIKPLSYLFEKIQSNFKTMLNLIIKCYIFIYAIKTVLLDINSDLLL